ncbi:type I-E CRISPR-associated protein Cas7/Cse4/CasC [Salinactinospora qingdaonensis]|uniref:Type I-E CRISPR-associated protein Cas7/Cse4/CasC n=1 Tax=Salinactinospora qingdaonensis TaxID=702744 RepID=A0ABP7G6W7_9ACTN
MTTPAYIDIHALQTLPYSNVNRDDLGAPKNLVFGGVERTRVSSQSWKRVIRKEVEKQLGADEETVRTRRVVVGVAEHLAEQGWSREEAEAAGIQVALSAGNGISLKQEQNEREEQVLTTNVLLLLPEAGIAELANLAAEHHEAILAEQQRKKKPREKTQPVLPGKDIAKILGRRSATINLFGRMLAELPGANVDGAVQMAHAFTTHATRVEYDFFAAVDDVEEKLNLPGSGHINTAMFSAGTFYRYANLDLAGLVANLNGDTTLAVTLISAFLDAFIRTLPSGKKNATAPSTAPELVHIGVRDDRPVSLASAFEAPLYSEQGHLQDSAERMDSHAAAIYRLLGAEHTLWSGHTASDNVAEPEHLGLAQPSFDDLVAAAVAACQEDHQ